MGSVRWLLALSLLVLLGCSGPPPRDTAAAPSSRDDAGRAGPDEGPDGTPDEEPAEEPADADRSDAAKGSEPAGFRGRISEITPALRARMSASHRAGCPVPLTRLRHLEVSYRDFAGVARTGELVVAAQHARGVVEVFRELFEAGFPIRRMELVDVYGGDDDRSMAANNTSAYNCRRVAGTDRWSEHAYGGAIDLNPVQNPYVQGASFVPAEGAPYVDVPRGPRARPEPGVIVADDVVVRAFARIGWQWGGTWRTSRDYQHFSATGR